MNAFVNVELTKWPRLLVVGDRVTEEQANEILVRTNQWSFHTNDKEWQATICGLAGIPTHPEMGWPMPSREFDDQIDCLPLHHLHNARIVSSWIGGPHGWCDWDGTIGCSNYNIGKWPSVEDVTEDWQAIATAFPYLTLTAQLAPEEGAAGGPVVEWRVANGAVETVEPTRLLTAPTEPAFMSVFVRGGERGVSFGRLSAALEQVRKAVSHD